MTRCCSDSIKRAGLRNPSEGLEIPCRWCTAYLRYERISPTSDVVGWVVHDKIGDFVKRESDPIATEAREKAYERILGKERER